MSRKTWKKTLKFIDKIDYVTERQKELLMAIAAIEHENKTVTSPDDISCLNPKGIADWYGVSEQLIIADLEELKLLGLISNEEKQNANT